MGPAMNILLAVVLMWVVLMQGAQVPAYIDQAPVIGSVAAGLARRAKRDPAWRPHRPRGGREVATWEDLVIAIGHEARAGGAGRAGARRERR
jgi:hypothetical protein